MDALLQVESVSSSQNARALRKLLDGVSSHVHSLQSLGVEPDSYSSLLCPVLISKLPPDLQLLISRTVSEGEWKLDSLMKAIEDEVSARERVTNQSRPPTRRNEHRPPPSATSLVSSGTTSSNTHCDQLHSPGTCSKVPQIEARKQILRRSGRCFSEGTSRSRLPFSGSLPHLQG